MCNRYLVLCQFELQLGQALAKVLDCVEAIIAAAFYTKLKDWGIIGLADNAFDGELLSALWTTGLCSHLLYGIVAIGATGHFEGRKVFSCNARHTGASL